MAPCQACSLRWHGLVARGLGGCESCLVARRVSMSMVEETWESLAKKPGGDRDREYVWGHPREQLSTMQQARLTVMRGYVLDVSHAPDSIRGELRYGGDNDWVVPTASGLLVPITTYWPDEA